jgi:segregation and condensation protein A
MNENSQLLKPNPKPPFTIKTEGFEGPLDLLLSLIEKKKLFINDISLSKVTDEYIAHVENMQTFPIADSAHFILIASTLLLIKSKSLLPTLELTEEEQGSIEDLQKRLALYQKMKELGLHVKTLFGRDIIFPKTESKNIQPVFSPEKEIEPQNIFLLIKNVLKNVPKKELIPKAIVKKVISLEETISNLTSRIKNSLKMSFKDFSQHGKEEKVNVIVSFLAMLELVKQGIINVSQDQHFQDINMETESVGIPKYN